jgi:colanic acid biosynthesis glycosyl transferase WcaI
MPSKLTSIFACGGAVVATAAQWTELARTVREAGGCVCPTGDATALAACIERLAGDPEARRTMGAQARDYAINRLDKSMILGELLTHLQSLEHPSDSRILESSAQSIQ